MIDVGDIKLYSLSFAGFAMSLTNIDVILKILLLAVTIGYTIQKWYLLNKDK
jgi:hypothetical protein